MSYLPKNFKLVRTLKSVPIAIMPHGKDQRWYKNQTRILIALEIKNFGFIIYDLTSKFWLDMRSGGKIPDLVEPNIGNQQDAIDWAVHDVNGYGTLLGYAETNELLRQMRIESNGGKKMARVVKLAVSTSKSWFGIPKPGDREYPNLDAFSIRFAKTLPDICWLPKDADE